MADSFAKISAVVVNIEAPAPWSYERNRLLSWGNAVGIGHSRRQTPALENEEVAKQVAALLFRLEQTFKNDAAIINNCGLVRKKSHGVGGVFKKGFKKLAGKSDPHSGSSKGPGESEQKWVVKSPQVWTAILGQFTKEINLLESLATGAELGAVTEGMENVTVSSLQPKPQISAAHLASPALAAAAAAAAAANTGDSQNEITEAEYEQEQMWVELLKLEEFIKIKDKGALGVTLSPSSNYSAKIRVRVYYGEDSVPNVWHDEAMGYVKMRHGSFGK
ncbi:hypothetical protein ABW20_dc0100644 [Dactylellina cionopaga]|nr:hypothetical protein ABW20_dc0100644 [Dactylellina cionopaga]